MAEIKGTSLRVNEDDLKKFKEYMKEFDLTQAETFQAIINSFEILGLYEYNLLPIFSYLSITSFKSSCVITNG